jgi:hypothetical protein
MAESKLKSILVAMLDDLSEDEYRKLIGLVGQVISTTGLKEVEKKAVNPPTEKKRVSRPKKVKGPYHFNGEIFNTLDDLTSAINAHRLEDHLLHTGHVSAWIQQGGNLENLKQDLPVTESWEVTAPVVPRQQPARKLMHSVNGQIGVIDGAGH